MCLARAATVRFSPCRHVTCCEGCYCRLPSPRLCPLCRQRIEEADDEKLLALALQESLDFQQPQPRLQPQPIPAVEETPGTASALQGTMAPGNSVRPSSANPARRRRQQRLHALQAGPPVDSEETLQATRREKRPLCPTLPSGTREDPSWHLPELSPAGAECRAAQRLAPAAAAAGTVLVWLRVGDFRLADNPALHAAAQTDAAVVPVFVLPPASEEGGWPLRGAARFWAHHSLNQLQHSLESLGSHLVLRDGSHEGGSGGALLRLAAETGARAVLFNALYEPWHVAIDAQVAAALRAAGVGVHEFRGNVLYEPGVASPDEGPNRHGFGSVGFLKIEI